MQRSASWRKQVLEDMDEVDEDRDLDVTLFRFGRDAVDLVGVTVHERDLGTCMVGVTPVGLVEDVGDDPGGWSSSPALRAMMWAGLRPTGVMS